jgi:hypothetical protein
MDRTKKHPRLRLAPPVTSAAEQAVEAVGPRLVVTIAAALSPVVKYHGLGHRYLITSSFPDAAAA